MPVGLSLDATSTLSLSRLQYPSATRICQREIFREKPTNAAAHLLNDHGLVDQVVLQSGRLELIDAGLQI